MRFETRVQTAENFYMFVAFLTIYIYNLEYTIMEKKIVLLLIYLCFLVLSTSIGVAPCPRQYDVGSVLSARIIISSRNGLIPLTDGIDSQCYNYTLPYTFARVPEIAIGLDDFDSEACDDLFFAVKPIKTESKNLVPLTIRTQWSHTRWSRIAIYLFAEDRSQLESGYYQVDAGALTSCQTGKEIKVLLPFKGLDTSKGSINHYLFLHGFEISTQNFSNTKRSPYELQIVGTSANYSGISIMFSVTTITQVHAIHISYIAFVQTSLNLIHGSYIFDATIDALIQHIPSENIGRNYARIHGINGFIINHNYQELSFKAKWTGSKFLFNLGNSQALTQYLSYAYIFLMGSECSDCPGYPITHEGKCVNVCPLDYFVTPEKICMTCGDGQHWNGTACQKSCPTGQFLNPGNNQCQCPAGLNWNGELCISCNSGKIFNPKTNLCECPPGLRWNGYGCANVPKCSNGREWNVYSYSCECPLGATWNGTFCVGIKNCFNGKVLNDKYECVCPENTYWNGNWCQDAGCVGGQEWDGKKCVCPAGQHFNGTLCIECINGQVWNSGTKKCQCEKGFRWNGNFCQKFHTCSGGRIYNETVQHCVCKDGHFWNGFACMVQPECCCGKRWNNNIYQCQCPESFNWDGSLCVQCLNGKVWDNSKNRCVCQPGTQWNDNFCVVIQQCQGGMIWNQNTWTCQCPSATVWNGQYCMANPCKGGKVWDAIKKQCICAGSTIEKNGRCVPPEKACENGQVWDSLSLSCKCPPSLWYNGQACITITVCKSNQIYNPLNNKCQCQVGFVWLSGKNSCADPTCQVGERWDGNGCVKISCPPGSYYNGTECICPGPNDKKCKPWEYWNGVQCVYFPEQCPAGTQWNKTACAPIGGGCPIGFYGEVSDCKILPQQCAPGTAWLQEKKICKPSGNTCPTGTYLSGPSCQPYVPCQNGQSWDPTRFLCICPSDTDWNGDKCVPCTGGKKWVKGRGCECPIGTFFSGSRCNSVDTTRCSNIPNAHWQNNMCVCKEGFDVVGMQCLCDGVIIGDVCDRCAHKPHSSWYHGICKCKPGFYQHFDKCVSNTPGNDSASSCSVGTYFDQQQKRCLACPDGCLRCQDCYTCLECRPEFNYDPLTDLCMEHCGDGQKFVSECDDGNNADGDGCSMDCRVQPGYNCRGGSPNSPDICIVFQPAEITMRQTGQIRYQTKIVINIKIDYLPQQLLQSSDCNDRCSSILLTQLKTGDTGALSTKSSYLPGSSYSFSIEIEFGRAYIGEFTGEVRVNPVVQAKYFGTVGASQILEVRVQPAYLSTVGSDKQDIL